MLRAGKTTLSTTVLIWPEASVQVCSTAPATSPPAAKAGTQRHNGQGENDEEHLKNALAFHDRFPPIKKNGGPPRWDGPPGSNDMAAGLVAGAGQGLGGLVDLGHPAGGGHDPLAVVDAAHIRLVDELGASGEPGDHIAVHLRAPPPAGSWRAPRRTPP